MSSSTLKGPFMRRSCGLVVLAFSAVAFAMLANGFLPDTISSDVHALCIDGPAFDQVTTMSKFLCLGLDLATVVNQAVEIYVHVFYNFVPREDWQFGRDGDHPLP